MDNHQICTIFGLGHPKTKRVQFADIPFYVIPRWLQYKCLARMWWVRVFPSIYVISIYSVLYVQYSIYLYLIVFVYVDVCVCECLYMYLYMSYVSVCIYVDMFHSLVFLAQLKPIVKHGEGLWAADEDPQGGRPWWLIVQLISNDRGSKRLLRHFSTETVGGKMDLDSIFSGWTSPVNWMSKTFQQSVRPTPLLLMAEFLWSISCKDWEI